jgi:hypothetical protein
MESRTATPPTVRRRERAAAAPDETGRRPLAAGHVVVVVLVTLALGTLLNARGLRTSAELRDPGWQRDTTLALTRPLAWLSGATLLDRPRAALEDAAGRSDETGLKSGTAFQPETASPPLPPPAGEERRERPVFSAGHPARLWVAGDSLVVTPGESIIRAAEDTHAVRAVAPVDGHISTGLSRPDVFDWYRHIRRELQRRKPDVVVLGFGGNDDHPYMTGLPKDVTLDDFGGPIWTREYRRRVEAVMELVERHARLLVWIGLPITHDAGQTRRFEVINAVVHDAAVDRENVVFLDTYTMFAGGDGGYAQYLPDDQGALVKVRGDDGVHFERAGGDRVAAEFVERLGEAFELRGS